MVGEKIVGRAKAVLENSMANLKTLQTEGVADFVLMGSRRMKQANKSLLGRS